MHKPVARPITIVVVDDDLGVLGAEAALLRELGHDVLQAPGSHHALYLIERHPEIELLFTDVMLPTIDGPELARQARARNPDLKTLYVSGYPEQVLTRKPIDAELLPKPLRLTHLSDALQRLFPDR